MLRVVRAPGLFLAAVAVFTLACGGDDETEKSSVGEPGVDVVTTSTPPARKTRDERPIPAFSGWSLEDEKIEISSFLGRRTIVFFFNPEVSESRLVARAVASITKLRADHNFSILGIAIGSSRDKAAEFVAAEGIDYPVIDDSAASISRKFGMRTPVAILGVDAEGYLVFGFQQFPTEGAHASVAIEGQLRDAMRLPSGDSPLATQLGDRPRAPSFEAEVLDSEEPFRLADQAGRPVVLIFFLHTCPHCHHALSFLEESLANLPEDRRPVFVGIEVSGRTHETRARLQSEGLDFFPVLFDRDNSIREAYGVFAGVPDTFLIDADGRIAARVRGWSERTDEPILRMKLARLAGAPIPMLLRTKGYSGSEVCGICHASEHETWELTAHATAFNTLVKHGDETDPECVSCHVVGYDKAGGYTTSLETPDLEDVGCESCHGRGGPHLSPGIVTESNYENACAVCHDAKHSLGFDYAVFLPRVSHAANAHFAGLPADVKQRMLAERGRLAKDLLPTRAAYVGSDACATCHASEFDTWKASPHAASVATLESKGKAGDADCLACHTTGFGKAGGFPTTGGAADHADLARVGCESCHGPGGDHVAPDAPKFGTIVSLADKCDSCAILQVCGGCHDDVNDPGFEFEVEAKIELQHHGTIEPGTGKPKASSASHATVEAQVARAFRTLEAGS